MFDKSVEPNLFIVGFQKCGSSLLFDLLEKHPQISGTDPKETFFLTDPIYENYNPAKNFNNPVAKWDIFLPQSQNTRYILEGTVANFYQATALEYIKSKENSRVIFIVRDPVERFISNYKYYSNNIPKLKGKLELEEYYQNVVEGAYKEDSLKYAIEHGCYHRYIEQWKKALGNERVLIVGMSSLLKDTQVQVNQIFKFLNLPEHQVQVEDKVNKSVRVRYKALHRILANYLGGDFPLKKNLKKFYYRYLTSDLELKPDNGLILKLKSYYKEEYDHYSNLF